MNFVHSFAVSFCSWIAITLSGLAFFRNHPLKYRKEIVIVSFFAASLSLVIQYYNEIALITFLPPMLAYIVFAVLTGSGWLRSFTIIFVGVTISGLLEFAVTFLFSRCDISLTLIKLADDYTVESWCFVALHLLLSLYILKNRWGFTSLSKLHCHKPNHTIMWVILIISVVNSIAGVIIAFRQNSILWAALFLLVLFIVYTVLNYRKE